MKSSLIVLAGSLMAVLAHPEPKPSRFAVSRLIWWSNSEDEYPMKAVDTYTQEHAQDHHDDYHTMAYCKDHLYYCGWNLMKVGRYSVEIRDALDRVGNHSPSDHDKDHSLFYCRNNADNGVGHERYCGQCKDGGDGASDYCDNVGP